jgi:hypothetical protein
VTSTTSTLTNGRTYAAGTHREYIAESTDVSWYPASSGFCYLKIDTSAPPMPAVSSTAYPEFDPDNQVAYGAEGQPGAFTFTAGASDVNAYLYRVNDGQWLSRATTGGTAVAVNVVPDRFGINHTRVHQDGANPSATREYDHGGLRPGAGRHLNLDGRVATAADTGGGGRNATLPAGRGPASRARATPGARRGGRLCRHYRAGAGHHGEPRWPRGCG